MGVLDVDRKTVFVNLFLVLLGAAIFFAGFEFILRAELIPHTIRGDDVRIMCMGDERGQFHPVYGWTEKPGSQYLERITTEDDWSLHTYNEDGFRDTFNSGERNVIVLGDSFTRGTLVGDNETFTFLLDAWTPDTAFHNYGIGNYGTANELALYQDIADEKEHQLVILAYFLGNDAADNVDGNPKRPAYTVEDGGVELAHAPQEVSDLEETLSSGGGLVQVPAIQRVQDVLRRNTRSYQFINRKVRILLSRFSGYQGPPTGEALQDRLELTKALLDEVGHTADRHDAAFLIVIVPSKAEITGNPPEAHATYWNAQRNMLNKVAAAENIRLLDLKPALQDAPTTQQLFGVLDAHMNEKGHRVVAKTIYDTLADQGHIENSAAEFTTDFGIPVTRCEPI